MSIYRRPKFLELLLEIRREMALEADYDVDLFVGRIHDRNEGDVSNLYTRPAAPVEIKKAGRRRQKAPKT